MHAPDDDAWLLEHSRVLGDRVRATRKDRKLSQEQLHLRAGVSRDVLQKIESGRQNPTYFTLLRIARVLEVPLTELLR